MPNLCRVLGLCQPAFERQISFSSIYEWHVYCTEPCGEPGVVQGGAKTWCHHVADVVALFTAALEPDEVVLGGGTVKRLKLLPPKCRAGDNHNAFLGGFRLWDAGQPSSSPRTQFIPGQSRTKDNRYEHPGSPKASARETLVPEGSRDHDKSRERVNPASW